jgi:DNA-binding MltR family transcriptional regulator
MGTEPFGWMRLTPEHKEKVFQLFGDLSEYFRLLRKETDRGCAMIVAAHLDDKLGELLKACLIKDKEYEEEISRFFKDPEPLGTFSARIKLAHYLNIISPQVRKDLDTIRKIRNDFAHKLEFEDFNSQSIKDRCMNLQHDLLEDNRDPRERFINAANVLIVFIDFRRANSPGVFILGSNPRDVKIALMQDIMNAAASVHESKE